MAVWVALVAAWELGVRALHASGSSSGIFFPAPSAIARALGAEVATGDLLGHFMATVVRILAGLLIGGGAGLLLGVAMGAWRGLRNTLDPIVAAMHPVPKLAIFPLLIVLLGIGEHSKIAAVAVGAFFPMLLNTLAGVRSIDPVHLDLAKNYGATKWQLCRRIYLPGSLPLILTGLRIATNVAFHATIGVEMVGAKTGLGSLLWLSWQTFRIEELYATLVVIAVIGVALTATLRWLARRGAPWLGEQQAAA